MQKNCAAFIVPTGIGASIGGFAGDASCVARELAEVCPLIINPNVVNAAVFSGITDAMLYTEGFALDEFFKGNIALRATSSAKEFGQLSMTNKIGVIFDKAIPQEILNVHRNTLNALKIVYGYDILEPLITDKEVNVGFSLTNNGISSGTVENSETLIKAGKKLQARGAQAISVVCLFDEPEDDSYSQGEGVDVVGGVEAIISHILTKELMLPVAHAPAFKDISICTELVDSRAAAEYITPTFLPCIIHGLSKAPSLVPICQSQKNDITIQTLKALIMPYNALGCVPVLKAMEHSIPIIAVKENRSVLNVTTQTLGIETIEVDTYQQAKETLIKLLA